MKWTITVEVEANHTAGQFASRDELEQQIIDAIDNANPAQLDGDNGGEYEVTEWEVSA